MFTECPKKKLCEKKACLWVGKDTFKEAVPGIESKLENKTATVEKEHRKKQKRKQTIEFCF